MHGWGQDSKRGRDERGILTKKLHITVIFNRPEEEQKIVR